MALQATSNSTELTAIIRSSSPLSVISAILGPYNHKPDTVLTFGDCAWRFLEYAWLRADCYPADRLGLHCIYSNVDAYRDTRSLSIISYLRLPYIPSLLELFQGSSSPRLHPVLYYALAGDTLAPSVLLTSQALRKPDRFIHNAQLKHIGAVENQLGIPAIVMRYSFSTDFEGSDQAFSPWEQGQISDLSRARASLRI